MSQTILSLTEKQQHFKQAGRLSQQAAPAVYQKYDAYSFEQQFQDRGHASQARGGRAQAGLHASGHHKVLDYLSLSLSSPLYYHPHNLLSQTFTKTIKDLLPHSSEFRACVHHPAGREKDPSVVKDALRYLIKSDFVWNDRYKSDFSQEYYQAQGAVTPLLTGAGAPPGDAADPGESPGSFRQQMILVNTKDMINVFKSRMKVLTESLNKMQRGSQPQGDAQLADDKASSSEKASNDPSG